ncbi:conjugal transfer protein TrbL family protein [Lederbergia lenta]|uniref:conjugal transfer protein TrbL family protein n=1 Tax=Lederbergia lenta TaxID=1467 RepID=UPI0032E7FBC0
MDDFKDFVGFIGTVVAWFKNFNQNIYDLSLNLLSWSYETLVNVVLHTPLFLFNNEFVKNTSIIFSISSVSIITLLTIYEGIMKMLKKRHTDFSQILKRFPLVVAGSGFSPFLFEKAFTIINQLTKGITSLGGAILSGNAFAEVFKVGSMDVLGLLVFDVVLIALLIPILMQNGKRWWDLFCLSAITPLALSAWMFNRHAHLFNQWWGSVKRLSLVQLVYATFILMLGLFIYGTRFIAPEAWLIKLLIIVGGLYRLANPPQFVKSYTRGAETIDSVYDDYKNTGKKVWDTVTLRNLRPANFIREKMFNSQHARKRATQDLRSKHGKRFVKGLK